MPHVVIIGGSYGGAKVAHKVLKDIPQAKVTLIDRSEHFYHNIAAPRVLARPKEIDFSKVLIPIADKFKQYPADRFTFVRGNVTAVNVNAKSVEIQGHEAISYDYLVVASGSTTPATIGPEAIPFKNTADNDIREKIKAAQRRIADADSIVIIGAGPVGVEAAGEIAQAHPKKHVTLVSSHGQVLPALKQSAVNAAASALRNLGVKIIYSTRVTETKQDSSTGRSIVHLDNGKHLEAGLAISAAGNLPNTSFMPATALDAQGWIKVDEHLRIDSVTDDSAYALGDATAYKQRYALKLQEQIPVVAGNIKAAVSGSKRLETYDAGDRLMVFVPVGKKTGTGQVGGWVPWGFVVAFANGRDYFMSRAGGFIGA